MPIQIDQIQGHVTEKITIEFGKDGDLNLTILPNKFTKGFQRQLKAAAANEDETGIVDLFFTLVKDWDVLDEKGKKLPITTETTDQLGMTVLSDILLKVQETIAPKSETTSTV